MCVKLVENNSSEYGLSKNQNQQRIIGVSINKLF